MGPDSHVDDAVVAHVRRGYRRMQAGSWALGLAIAAVAVGLHPHLLEGSPVPRLPFPLVAAVGAGVALCYAPVVRAGDTIEFRTNHPPDAVRESFLGGVNPLTVGAIALADDDGVEIDRSGVTAETTRLGGLYTTQTSYETEERPDGDLLVRSTKNGTESTTARVSIRPDDGGTRVTVVAEREDRISPRTLALYWLRGTQVRKAWSETGYEVVEAESRVGVLG